MSNDDLEPEEGSGNKEESKSANGGGAGGKHI
jgi:hypothetical protein